MNALIFSLLLHMSVFSPPKSPEDFRWQKRIIVNYSSEGFDSEFLSNHRQEIRERKLLMVHMVGKSLIWTNAEESLDVSGFMELKEKIRPTSTWVLVGLDGGVKSQGGSELPMEELFRLIDSMPMRQSEMRKDNKQK